MKKTIIVSVLLCSILLVPVFASAQTPTTSDTVNQQLIQTLTQLILQLEQQIQQILSQQKTQTNVSAQPMASITTPVVNNASISATTNTTQNQSIQNLQINGSTTGATVGSVSQTPSVTPTVVPSCTINITKTPSINPNTGVIDYSNMYENLDIQWTSQNAQTPMDLFSNYFSQGQSSVNCELGTCVLTQSSLPTNGSRIDPYPDVLPKSGALEYKIVMSNGTSCESQIPVQ